MSPGVVPARVWMFEKEGRPRLVPPGPLARVDGGLVVPQGWLNAVKAQYTRALRALNPVQGTSPVQFPPLVQRALAERLGPCWREARGHRILVAQRDTIGAWVRRHRGGLLELCIYTENAALLAVGYARQGATRFTWSASPQTA